MDKRLEYVSLRSKFDAELPKSCGNCAKSDGELHIHHIIPLAKGGNNVITNLVRLCSGCHSKVHGESKLVELAQNRLLEGISGGGKRNGTIPYGYTANRHTYVPDDNADIVRWIFDLRYKCEYSTLNIATILNNMAIPSPRNGGSWAHATVKRIVENPIYLGETHYGGEYYGDLYTPILDTETIERIEHFNRKYKKSRVPIRKVPDMTA